MKKLSKTTIEWSEMVWNFLTGCTKISAGCKFCYMFRLAARLKAMGNPMYRNGAELTVHEEKLILPYHVKKPTKFFVNSMSDMFHEEVPVSILVTAFEVMNQTPQHTYQILTKRPERLLALQHLFNFTPNIWIGVSVEDDRVLHRVDTLRKIHAGVKWISAEPLIGPLSNLSLEGISWLVVGGESGIEKTIREIKEEWVLELKEKCLKNNVPFFFKQWGKARFNPNTNDPTISKEHPHYAKGGCQLQGNVYREFPKATTTNLISTVMKTVQNENSDQNTQISVDSLSPFKKIIGIALLAGEKPEGLATRLANERNIPKPTARAYVTMVQKYLNIDLFQGKSDHSASNVIFPSVGEARTLEDKKKVVQVIDKHLMDDGFDVSNSINDNLKSKIENLSPFKKSIGFALIKGENPVTLATRLAIERGMPRPTAKAYVTMVQKLINDKNQNSTIGAKIIPLSIISLPPFKKQIALALISGEEPILLISRLATERGMPKKTAQAYVTMVHKLLSGKAAS